MAYSNNSALLSKLRGMLNKELVFREWEGKAVVSKAPKRRKRKSTPDQKTTRINFKLASRYAKAVLKAEDQNLADAYALVLKPRQNLYSRALEDFMTVPEIKFIRTNNYRGEVGDKISIRAVDDFRVLNVEVDIHAGEGSTLESGNAVQNVNGIDWTYTITKANNMLSGTVIRVIAKDVPGNVGMLELKL